MSELAYRAWDKKGGRFLHHFLPSIRGLEPKESIDMNEQLQKYFEFVANVWLSFAPSDLKKEFPRDFKFPVTVPHSFLGELPPELREGVRQLEVHITTSEPNKNQEAEEIKGNVDAAKVE